MDEKDLIEFLKEHLRIRVDQSDLWVCGESIRVTLQLYMDGEVTDIDSDVMRL